MQVMAANPGRPVVPINIVDGFSGGGRYRLEDTKQIVDGSPLIFLKTLDRAERAIQAERRNNFRIDAQYYFVDSDPKALGFLSESLAQDGFRSRINENIHLLCGEFETVLPGLLKDIKRGRRKPRCIFLLDQYGYTDVPLRLLRKIFSEVPNAEVLLTFATDHLINYMADTPVYRQALKSVGLDDVFGSSVIQQHKESPKARFVVEQTLHRALHLKSGARFFTPFFITSGQSRRSYWLVHLSSHAKARDEMCSVHWSLHNHFAHYGTAGLRMLGFDPLRDDADQHCFEFLFDDDAKTRTHDALLEDLPQFISQHDRISFESLLVSTVNSTPATSAHFCDVLARLSHEKVLEICGRNGERRRSPNTIRPDDVIFLARQLRIDLGSSE